MMATKRGVLYPEAPEAPGSDPFAPDLVEPIDLMLDDAADLADVVAEWRRVSELHDTTLRQAAALGIKARAHQAAAERILRRDPTRWLAAPPTGCELSVGIRLSSDD